MEALKSTSRISGKYRNDAVPFGGGGSEDGRYVSEEEYWEKYYQDPDFAYEWKNGYLEEKPMADVRSSLVYQWFCDILRCYFKTYPVGTIVNLDIGFRLALPSGISIRKPDMAIVLNDNPVMANPTDCNFSGIYDMCIESLSYSTLKDIKRDTVDKKKEYEGGGVKEYYVLDARKIETAFWRLNEKKKYRKINPDDGIIRSEVLPGFRFRISDLYDQPSLEELTEDVVYQEYVLPFHRKARQKAELAEKYAESERLRAERAESRMILEQQKAEQEHLRAESERLRAERLAAKLRELGIEA